MKIKMKNVQHVENLCQTSCLKKKEKERNKFFTIHFPMSDLSVNLALHTSQCF